MSTKPTTIDQYLENLPEEHRRALQKLRTQIQAAAPKAEECISYGIAAFKLNGMLVGLGATKKHCAFYVMSSSIADQFTDQLEKYDTSKGTIRFQPDKPLPVSLVKKIVKARIVENGAK